MRGVTFIRALIVLHRTYAALGTHVRPHTLVLFITRPFLRLVRLVPPGAARLRRAPAPTRIRAAAPAPHRLRLPAPARAVSRISSRGRGAGGSAQIVTSREHHLRPAPCALRPIFRRSNPWPTFPASTTWT